MIIIKWLINIYSVNWTEPHIDTTLFSHDHKSTTYLIKSIYKYESTVIIMFDYEIINPVHIWLFIIINEYSDYWSDRYDW